VSIRISHTELTDGRHGGVFLDYAAHGHPVTITQDGKPIAVLISVETFEAVRALVDAMHPGDDAPVPLAQVGH
jgi:prevent-host-death family protein